jgi:V-type H+-transporting ATPase subunit H
MTSSLDHDERIPLFARAALSDPDLPYAPLIRYAPSMSLTSLQDQWSHVRTLEAQDDFVQLKSAQILTVLLR